MSEATYACPGLITFCRLDELGLLAVGQRLERDREALARRVVESDTDQWCRRCGWAGAVRDTVTRRLAHEPLGWRLATLESHHSALLVRRVPSRVAARHARCGAVAGQTVLRASLSRAALRWALEAIVCQHLIVARVTEALAVTGNTANDAVMAEGRRVLTRPHPTRPGSTEWSASMRMCGVTPNATTTTSP